VARLNRNFSSEVLEEGEIKGQLNFSSIAYIYIQNSKIEFESIGKLSVIVSDKKWIKNMAEIESKILPGITINGFDEGEKDKAIAWLQE
jgi:hypothetical protein